MSKEKFMLVLRDDFRGYTSNRKLREMLVWDTDFYLSVRAALVAEGMIKVGRGRGGTVRIV